MADIHITKEAGENAEVTLCGVLPTKDIVVFWDNALKGAQKEIAVPGFRKGHVPEERIIQEVGEAYLWKQAAEMALKEALPDILTKEAVSPIAPLGLALKNANKGEDVGFTITIVTPPTCDAGNYKAAATAALDALPQEDFTKEKTEAVQAFRTQIRALAKMKNPEEVKEGDAKENEDKASEVLTDDEAKFAGFENSAALEHFIDGEAEKAVKERSLQKKRGAVAEAIIAEAKCGVPKMFIDEEAKALVDVFKRDVVNQGLEWSEYLKRVNKDEMAVTADLRPQAEKRIILDLAFGDIMRKEALKLDDEDKKKEEEIAHALATQEVPHERAHVYAREQLLREKVWGVLGVKTETSEFESETKTERTK